MKQNFFEAMGIASIERIHTQMIYWIFQDENNTLSNVEKTNLLNNILGINKKTYAKFTAITEYKNIDLIIICENNIGEIDLYVFENKIKSSQRKNQLSDYTKTINNDKRFNSINVYFSFLTLIKETAESKEWFNITYKELYNAIRKINIDIDSLDSYIITEYTNTLEALVNTVDEFETDHRSFPNVFTDGGKKKYEKLQSIQGYNHKQKYVAINNLETILQKLFYKKLAKEINLTNFSINETHGNALLQADILSGYVVEGKGFTFGLQLQNNTFKINFVSENYNKSDKTMLPQIIIDRMEVATKSTNYSRLNIKKRAYISITKKINQKIHELKFEEIVAIYKNEYENAKMIIETILSN